VIQVLRSLSPVAGAQINLAKQLPDWDTMMGHVFIQLRIARGDGDEVIDQLKQLCAGDPTNIVLQHRLAAAYAGSDQYSLAVKTLTKTLAFADQVDDPYCDSP